MTDQNSYLVDCTVQPVSEAGWQEIPAYRGHCWAEPDMAHLISKMQRIAEPEEGDAEAGTEEHRRAGREEAREKGRLAQQQVTARYNRTAVGVLMAEALSPMLAPTPVREESPVSSSTAELELHGTSNEKIKTGAPQTSASGRVKNALVKRRTI